MDVKDIGKKIENVELVEAMHAVRENENKSQSLMRMERLHSRTE